MPRRESEQFKLFETGLFLAGGCGPYLNNVRQLVRLLPSSEHDIAEAIEQNIIEIQRHIRRTQIILSEFADVIGYQYLRKEKKQCRK